MPNYKAIVNMTRDRYQYLVDKKLLSEITDDETVELKQLNYLLDASEDEYFEPIKQELAGLTIAALEERVAKMRAAIEKAIELLAYYIGHYQCTEPSVLRGITKALERSLK